MKVITKRTLALLMSLMLMVSLFVGVAVPAQAATVEYKYSGKYIYNWGTRGTTATFLSPNAIDFYEDNGVTFEQLAAYAGHSSATSVPSSNLYKQLQNLMKNNHDYETSYDATRDLFKYTDSQNNIKNSNKISAFYSATAVGPAWDSGNTWNREHVWPNSKGDDAGNGENDIMMLRPETQSNNSGRGNKAYGESSGFYDPNGLGQNVRGDAARILLYQHVRWGARSLFGSTGVIESKAILLKWMQEDPVDTWEMGRNDAVEAITGTRNVFVDYPQLAFELFETATPANYQTPSGVTAGGNVTNDPSQPDIPTVDPDTPSTGEGVITNPEVGVPYKFGMIQENLSTSDVYYLKGGMGNPEYYLATDTSVDAAIDVYLEQATDGYYLCTNYSGAKQYINMVVNDTHVNGVYEATASTVYRFDTDAMTVIASVDGSDYWFGTRNDKSYTTVGPCKTSYNGFYCKFYSANGAGGSTGGDTPDEPVVEPAANSYLTIAEAAALGATKSKDVYTEGKYYVTGTIKDVDNSSIGCMTITDGAGNDLYVYRTFSNDGTVGYSALNPKPVVGDTVTLYGVIGMYDEAQMKSGWIVAYTPGANPDQPSVGSAATITFDDKSKRTEFNSASQQVWEENGITVTNQKGGGNAIGDYANPLRCYKNSNVIIEYPNMTKLVISSVVYSDTSYADAWAAVTDSNVTATIDGNVVTINFTNPVNSFTWTGLTAQARAYSIEVFDGSEDVNHTHEYANACDADCNTCGAVRIVNHVYDNETDADCNACGSTREVAEPEAPACSHAYDNACDKTCNLCGETRTVAGHKYSNACDKTCNVCGATRTASAHKYTNACDKSCNVCKATRSIKHSYKTVTTKGTTTKNGSLKSVCKVCGYTASKVTTIYKASKVSLSTTSYTYTGGVKKPSVVVKDSKGNKISTSYYSVKYASGRKNVGTYKVTVTFKGRYSGSKVLTFKINPVKTTLKSITPGKKSLKVAINKKTAQVTGYQIQYSTSKTFKSYKVKSSTSYKKTTVTLTGLSAKKTYYVRVRTYKTVGGKKYYSGWSTIKYKKTK